MAAVAAVVATLVEVMAVVATCQAVDEEEDVETAVVVLPTVVTSPAVADEVISEEGTVDLIVAEVLSKVIVVEVEEPAVDVVK